jgi:hypothetical protein
MLPSLNLSRHLSGTPNASFFFLWRRGTVRPILKEVDLVGAETRLRLRAGQPKRFARQPTQRHFCTSRMVNTMSYRGAAELRDHRHPLLCARSPSLSVASVLVVALALVGFAPGHTAGAVADHVNADFLQDGRSKPSLHLVISSFRFGLSNTPWMLSLVSNHGRAFALLRLCRCPPRQRVRF